MKHFMNSQKLPRVMLALSLAAYTLRRFYYSAAMDHKNLLVSHPAGWALGAVTVAAILLVAVSVLRWNREPLQPLWPYLGDLPCYFMAAGTASVVLDGGFSMTGLLLVRNVLALVSAASLAAIPMLKKKGKAVPFFFYGVLCLFFAVHMVSSYQGWSSNPQIQDYLYSLLGGVGLMLYSYQKTAAAVGFRKEKWLMFLGLLTSFFCFVSLSDTSFPVLYLCGGYWALTDLPQTLSGE